MKQLQILFLQTELKRIIKTGESQSRRVAAIHLLIEHLENDEPCKNIQFVLGCLSLWRQSNIQNYDRRTAENLNDMVSELMESIELPLSDEVEKQTS